MRIFHAAWGVSKMTYVVLKFGDFWSLFARVYGEPAQKPSQFSPAGATIDGSHNSQIRRVLL